MKPYAISRIITILLFGLLMGFTNYHAQTKFHTVGRDEFLKRQAAYFDRHSADPPPPATEFARGIAMAGFSLGIYELVAFGILKLVGKKERRSRRH